MRKTTDTNPKYSDRDISDGEHEFEIVKVTDGPKGSDKWTLEYDGDQQGEQLLWPNNEGELLRILGCTETKKGIFDWETDLMEGRKFIATVTHEPDKKKPEVIRQVMKDFKKAKNDDSIPF